MKLTGFSRLGPSGPNGPFALHRTGCRDIERREKPEFAAQKIDEYETVAEALNDIIDAEMIEMGYTHDDVQVYPCTKVMRSQMANPL